MKHLLRVALLLLLTAGAARAQSPLSSFAYMSYGCTTISSSTGMLLFGPNPATDWMMGGVGARPGSNVFPTGPWFLRTIAFSYRATSPGSWAVVGHSGPNGDLVTPFLVGGGVREVTFLPDAMPYYLPGEFFDVHSTCDAVTNPNEWGAIVFFWLPAPPGLRAAHPPTGTAPRPSRLVVPPILLRLGEHAR